jgi:predicted amidohydrolase YtcJ
MDVTLTALELAGIRNYVGRQPLPPRIEHASMVDAEIIRRMRTLGVGAAVQPQFAWSDHWLLERVGAARAQGCYAFRTLWEAGIPLGGSTDSPVEPLDAMAAIGAMLHRPDWLPGEALSLETVLQVFSEGSYSLTGNAVGRGRLAPGAFADFVVLEHDPRLVPASEVHRIPVAMTVVDGEVRYAA